MKHSATDTTALPKHKASPRSTTPAPGGPGRRIRNSAWHILSALCWLGLAAPATADSFPRSIELAFLNGSNGFALNGISLDDRSGVSVSAAGDINGDGIGDVIIGAHYADPGGFLGLLQRRDAGQSYVVFGRATPLPAALELVGLNGFNGFAINGVEPNDRSGSSVAAAGDVNGDGIDDLIIGAPKADPDDRLGAGQGYVVFGRATPFPAALELSNLDGTNGFTLNGITGLTDPSGGDSAGYKVAGAGDVNGDGIDDIMISAVLVDPGLIFNAGQSYVVFGRTGGFPAVLELSALDGTNGFTLNGVGPGNLTGFSLAGAGDVNGDGIDDIIVATPFEDVGVLFQAGQSYVVYGRTGGFPAVLELSALDGTNGFTLDGFLDDFSGWSVSGAGDVNGDGVDDLIIGAAWAPLAGRSYVVFGRAQGFPAVLSLTSLDGIIGFKLTGIAAEDAAGSSVSRAGDVNGDGIDDLIVGAPYADVGRRLNAGQGYVVFGRAGGFPAILGLAGLDGTNGFALNGVAAWDFSGISVSGAGDINGDGVDDVIIGAMAADPGGRLSAGRSYVVLGRSAASVSGQ